MKNISYCKSAFVLVAITGPGFPSFILLGPSGRVQQTDVITVSVNLLKLPISACSYQWSVSGCPNQVCIQGNKASDYIRINLARIISFDNNTLQVTVSVTENSSGRSTQHFLIIPVDPLPTIGQISVSPSTGTAWITNYTLEATGFTLSEGLAYYEFGYYKPETTRYIPLTLQTISPTLTTMLPAGNNIQGGFIVQLAVRVYNQNGGYVQVNVTVKNQPLFTSMSVLDKYKQMKQSGDITDSSSMLMQAFVGSLLLSEKNDLNATYFSTNPNPCNSNGVWTTSLGCICNAGFRKEKIAAYQMLNLQQKAS